MDFNQYIQRLDQKVVRVLKDIGRAAQQAKMQAYLVGGPVRDLFLGAKNIDLDVVVEGNGIALARRLKKKWKAALTEHARFGTATLSTGHFTLDLATARRERYLRPGALPKVTPSVIQEDLCRRDFAINTMAMSLCPETFATLIDPLEGRKDLANKRIRILHVKSFIDDPTRILRAVRFEQRFGFRLEGKTLRLMKEALQDKALGTVTKPRLFQEFMKVVKEPNPLAAIRRLQSLGALQRLFSQSLNLSGLRKSLDRWEKGQKQISYQRECHRDVFLLCTLLQGWSCQSLKALIKAVQIKKDVAECLIQTNMIISRSVGIKKQSLQPSAVFQHLKDYRAEAIIFLRLTTDSKIIIAHVDRYMQKSRDAKLAINGDDILRLMAKGSDKKIGRIKTELLLKRIDGKLRTRLSQERYVRAWSDK